MSKIRAKQRADFFGTSSEFNYKLNNSLARPPNTLAAEQSETLIKIFQEDNTYIGSPKTIHEPTQSKPNLIGFSELPARLLEKLKKREFHFNLMIIGYSGLGKSTFINSFFSSDIYNEDFKGPSERNEITKTTEVTKHSYYFEENDVKIRLTIIDTPGFGDHINNESCIDPIMEEINTRFSNYMAKELSINRNLKPNGASNYPSMYITEDERIHVCLYFVNPNTHGLSELDLNFLKKLHKKVPLIPIIAKADTLTIDECTKLKRKILYDIQTNELNIYNFSEKTQHSTEVKSEGCKSFSALRKKFPYAIVCSDKMITRADGKKVRGRNYPWGFVEVDNIDHNDFIALKSLLLKAHLEDLIDVTHQEHYDAYRRECLEEVCQVSNADDTGPLYHLEVEKREHKEKLKRLEAEMETIFQQKVNERTAKFRERELEFERQSAKILLRIEEELSKLEDDERLFLDQKTTWEANNREFLRKQLRFETIKDEDSRTLYSLFKLRMNEKRLKTNVKEIKRAYQPSPHPKVFLRRRPKSETRPANNSKLLRQLTPNINISTPIKSRSAPLAHFESSKINIGQPDHNWSQTRLYKSRSQKAVNTTSLLLSSNLVTDSTIYI